MTYAKPLPSIDRWNKPFWNAARRGELLLQTCEDCGHWWFPPAPVCPSCLSTRVTWKRASGRGKIWSRCRFHHIYDKAFADEAPYNVCMIELEEGPVFISNVVGADWEDIGIGDAVEACFEKATEEVTLVRFRLSEK